MRWLGYWAAVIAGAATTVSGCLTSQDNPGGEGRLEDPPITIERGGSGGTGQGAEGGEPSGGSNSRGGRSGAGGGSQGGSDSGCADDDDCEFRADDRNRCYLPTSECVECVSTADCGGSDCVNNECRVETPCSTAGDCPLGLVCNPTTELCVECVASANCDADEACVTNVCVKRCTTESVCALFGLHCDRGRGYCVECAGDSDCDENRNCQQGTCVRDICVAGTGTCTGTVPYTFISTCNEAGSVLSTAVACDPMTTCVEDDGQASCEPWVCTPGAYGCSTMTERIVDCSADGLEETVIEDCTATDQLCVDSVDMCMDVVCEPNTRFCQGDPPAATIQQCDSTGATPSLYQACATNQYCNATNPTNPICSALLCTPNMPTCNGNVLTTCNSTGTGYTSGGTDCTTTMQTCSPSGCTDATVDTLPASPTVPGSIGSYTMLNFYSVTTSRTLTLIEQYMNPPSALTITWHVYESTTQSGTYTRISPTPFTSTATIGAGYQSSGAVSIPLVAGRFYAIGISWVTTMGYGYQSSGLPLATTFGSLLSGYIQSGSSPAATIAFTSSSAWVPQRLTTAAP